MKKVIFSLILFCCCFAVFADEPVEVMVLMKARYDRIQLSRRAELYPTRAARRDYVVRELKAFAEASQHDLMVTLKELEQQGLVSLINSLWSANAISFKATKEVIQMLVERPDIENITPVRKYQCIPEWDAVSEIIDSTGDENDASIQRIFDLTGRVVSSEPDKLSPGVYLIQYRKDNKIKTKKTFIR